MVRHTRNSFLHLFAAGALLASLAIDARAHRFYQVYYRDPIVLGGCPATSTFNVTQAIDVSWSP